MTGDADDLGSAAPLPAWAMERVAVARQVWERIVAQLEHPEEVASWLMSWWPVVLKLQVILGLVQRILAGWGHLMSSPDAEGPLIDEAVVADLLEEGRALLEAAPEAASLMLGSLHLDEVIDAALGDEQASSIVGEVLSGIERRIEGMSERVVSLLLSDRKEELRTSEELLAFLSKAEVLLGRVVEELIVDRLVIPGRDRDQG